MCVNSHDLQALETSKNIETKLRLFLRTRSACCCSIPFLEFVALVLVHYCILICLKRTRLDRENYAEFIRIKIVISKLKVT